VSHKRFTDSSIFIKDLGKVYEEDLTSSSEICLYDHPALQELKKSRPARFRVYLTRLEPRITVYRDADMKDPMAVSRDLAENTIAQGETGVSAAPASSDPTATKSSHDASPPGKVEPLLSEALLFDASQVGQLMCLGIGRYSHNLLRPFMGEDAERYYDAPDELDPGALCGQISRDHGLIFLDDQARIFFRDFGTKKEGARKGSKNGTWINGAQKIQDLVIPWMEGDYLGIGGRAWVRRDGELVKEHVFKLRYEKIS
jgi:hypothetical protein